MIYSKNLVNKLLLTITLLFSLSLYSADPISSAKNSLCIAGNAFKTLEQEAIRSIEDIIQFEHSLEQELAFEQELKRLKPILQDFANKFIIAYEEAGEAIAEGDIKVSKPLKRMSDFNFKGKPIILLIKGKLAKVMSSKILNDNLEFMRFLSRPDMPVDEKSQSYLSRATKSKDIRAVKVLEILSNAPQGLDIDKK